MAEGIKSTTEAQSNVALSNSQTSQKSAYEKVSKLITEYYQGMTIEPYKTISKEIKTEAKVLLDTFYALKEGDYDNCKAIIKKELNRELLPFQKAYEYCKKKIGK